MITTLPHHLNEFLGKGKYTILEFSSLGCGPCQMAKPTLEKFYKQYKDKFEMITISADRLPEWKKKPLGEVSWHDWNDFKFAREILKKYDVPGFPAFVIIDSDLQDPPELIPEMLKLWEAGNDVIYGKRQKRRGESAFKLLTAKLFYKTLNALSETEIPRDTGDFRLVDRRVVDTINMFPEHNKFLRGLFSWVGYKQIPYEYERKERFAGKTKYPLSKMLKLAGDGILSFSTKPLKLVGLLGMCSIIVSILILVYSILSFAFKWNNLTAGWTSIMVTVTFFAGVQLLSIWIMSEYLARIYDESRGRPQYIIDKMYNI